MKNKTKIILIVVGVITILLLSLGVYWFYKNIHVFSILSIKSGCGLITEEELNELGYQTAGEFIVRDGETRIEVFTDDPRTLIHERCHQEQFEEKRLYSCQSLFLRYINEAECYFKQRL